MKQFIILFEFSLLNSIKANQFRDKIRTLGSYAFTTNNSCVIWVSSLNASVVMIRDYLKTDIGNGDKLFVAEVSAPAAWANIDNTVSDYLLKNLQDI